MRFEFEKLRASNELAAQDRRHTESLELDSASKTMELAAKLSIEEFQKLCNEAEKEHASELDNLKRRGMFDSLMELPRISYPRIDSVFQKNLRLVKQKNS